MLVRSEKHFQPPGLLSAMLQVRVLSFVNFELFHCNYATNAVNLIYGTIYALARICVDSWLDELTLKDMPIPPNLIILFLLSLNVTN